jgi:sporulation protein YlmC with PRC-barrel domain
MLKNLLLGAALTGVMASVALAQGSGSAPSPSAPGAPPAATAPARPVTTQPPNTLRARTLIGLDIKNAQNETIGSIDDVVVDTDGRVQQVVVSVGGFLGVGARSVAISWNDVHFDATREVATVNMTKDQLSAQPDFQRRRAEPTNTAPTTPRATPGMTPGAPPAGGTPPRTNN